MEDTTAHSTIGLYTLSEMQKFVVTRSYSAMAKIMYVHSYDSCLRMHALLKLSGATQQTLQHHWKRRSPKYISGSLDLYDIRREF
jgi:hypothetical protein